ncbi:MAG: hypothetical protein JSS20_08995 [Proteobacteria bacterium]|nr:hypothetical protein [Pseudomonadota bacterium]
MSSKLQTTGPGIAEMARWAQSYGLDKLSAEHLARMAELAVYVSELGRTLPRPTRKDDAPASESDIAT